MILLSSIYGLYQIQIQYFSWIRILEFKTLAKDYFTDLILGNCMRKLSVIVA